MKDLLTESKNVHGNKTVAPSSILWKLESDTQFRMAESEVKPFRAVFFEDEHVTTPENTELESRRYFLLLILLGVASVFTYLASTGRIGL